jgi:hypothetical protein
MAPEIGELEEPLPMVIFGITATLCAVFCFFIYLLENIQIKKD